MQNTDFLEKTNILIGTENVYETFFLLKIKIQNRWKVQQDMFGAEPQCSVRQQLPSSTQSSLF